MLRISAMGFEPLEVKAFVVAAREKDRKALDARDPRMAEVVDEVVTRTIEEAYRGFLDAVESRHD